MEELSSIIRRLALVICAALSPAASAVTVTLAWDAPTTAGIAGYELFYGTNNGSYSYSLNVSNNLSGAVNGLLPGLTYYFAVAAYDTNNNQSPLSNITALTIPSSFVITNEPVSQVVPAGGTATFSVGISGGGSVAFQWYEGRSSLPGATNATLVLSNVQSPDVESYSLVAGDSIGSVTSSVVTLAVIYPPAITREPASQSAAPGWSASFAVTASGTGPLSYQWYANGVALASATNNVLIIGNVTAADAGSYHAVIRNFGGATISSNALLQVTKAEILLAGTYNGLFCPTNTNSHANLNPASIGMLANCVLGTNSIFSATLNVGGVKYAFSGSLNSSGAESQVVGGAGRNPPAYQINLQLQLGSPSGQMTGSVSNMSASSPWTAVLYAAKKTNALPVPTGTFPLVLPAATNSPNSPSTPSQLEWTNSPSGQVTITGTLADGTAISQSAPVAADGTFPLYQSLYRGRGVLAGWLSLANGLASGVVAWIRPYGVLLPLNYPTGFTNVVEAQP